MLEPKNHNEGFSPLDTINRALRLWWLLVLLTFIGGMTGFFVHQVRPPVYEAVGQFSASIDYVATGPLTQYDEDVALNAVGNVILSRLLLDKVVAQATVEGIEIDRIGLQKMAVVERKFTTWDLRVRSTNAEQAKRIADIWVKEGQALLLESYEHAIRAELLNRYMRSLESCIGKSVSSEPSSVLCMRHSLAEIQTELKKAGEEFIQERKASYGLFAGITVGPETAPVLSQTPVSNGRSQLVLAGSAIGLLAGIWIISLEPSWRWWRKNKQ